MCIEMSVCTALKQHQFYPHRSIASIVSNLVDVCCTTFLVDLHERRQALAVDELVDLSRLELASGDLVVKQHVDFTESAALGLR